MEFENKPHGVYVKTDEADRIIAINSDAFLPDTEGWTRIDEGHGDRFHHAQGNYLAKPLTDERGIPRYKLADGKPVERTQEEMDGDWIEPVATPTIESRVETVEGKTGELEKALEMLLTGVVE